ncbi:DUF4229 domain-containing protein [Nocardioides taihuensis]|uniref:DUF4229 domain-containing protein n=1 Tax=Nocardioides taihuensis TaxID=1835606 RepID=A0ABW0BHQ4_9ACTN
MKEFVVYTGLRVVLFLASLGVVAGAWVLIAGDVPILWALVIAFVVSGIGSYFLLDRQREAFARRVDERARRASSKFEELRSKEDAD